MNQKTKAKKFDLLTIILLYLFLPFLIIYWGAVAIFWINGWFNSKRLEIEEAFKNLKSEDK